MSREGRRLVVFYSRIGDVPENILRSEVRLDGKWMDWKASEPVVTLHPLHAYEGAHHPKRTSVGGRARRSVHELRDPAVLIVGAERYLYYSVAGEQGIAVARFANPAETRQVTPRNTQRRSPMVDTAVSRQQE